MITRRKDYAKREPLKDASKIYIISEGTVSEIKYFNFFTGLSSNLQLIVVPSEKGSDPLKLMELGIEKLISDQRIYNLDYSERDQIWFVIDTDTWEQEGKITPLREFCALQNSIIPQKFDEVKPYSAWNVAQSNPCFEVWLYYHHYEEVVEEECVKDEPNIKRYIDSLILGGFDYDCDPVKISSAIKRAEDSFRLDANQKIDWFSTEVFRLGKEIQKYTEKEVNKLLGKLRSGHMPV